MNVAANGSRFAAHDHQQLAVGLEAQEAVDHVHAFLFQGTGPLDIAFLVEAGLQFDEDGYLGALFVGIEQGFHDG